MAGIRRQQPCAGLGVRLLAWVFARCAGTGKANETAIGFLPTPDAIDLKGLEGEVSAADLEVYCLQYRGSADHKLDYEVHTARTTDTGEQAALDYTGVQNFKRFVSKLFACVIEGDVDAARFRADC